MDTSLKQIGERLKGLREIFNISPEEIAQLCDISLEHYFKIEAGEATLLSIDYQRLPNAITLVSTPFVWRRRSHE